LRFDPAARRCGGRGNGLKNMHDRLRSIGGALNASNGRRAPALPRLADKPPAAT